ncbi:MAG: hypothetical protein E6G90_19030 [Alphaproteobacteria bacterium]|nr:MAG: hypothetical protein E6G90_19030 [Alphaproteobacteria bacterium]
MSLEALKLCDHSSACWDQRVTILVRVCAGCEDLGKARGGGSLLGRIERSGGNQVINHLSGLFDASSRDAATVRVAQQEAACFREPNRVGCPGDSDTHEEQSSRG